MSTQHPITPPPELVEQWRKSGPADAAVNNAYERHIATQAARWGAEQELEACVNYVDNTISGNKARALRAARRPSLKEQALAELELLRGDANAHGLGFDAPAIRRALEQLDD